MGFARIDELGDRLSELDERGLELTRRVLAGPRSRRAR